PDPAGLGDVHHHAVGPAVLDLDVGVAMALTHPQRLIDVIAAGRAGRGQALADLFQTLHLEADVVDAAEALAPLGPPCGLALEVEDRQVEVTIGQVVAPRRRAVDAADLLHPEDVDVELGRLVNVLGRQRDVLDLGHAVLLSWVLPVAPHRRREPSPCPARYAR